VLSAMIRDLASMELAGRAPRSGGASGGMGAWSSFLWHGNQRESKGMASISVIGLGIMGTALVRVLMERGYEVTVWNRTSE